MGYRINWKPLIILYFLLLFTDYIIAQPVWDTANISSRHEAGSGKYKPTLRLGFGTNKNLQDNNYYDAEVGINFTRIHQVWMLSNISNRYLSLGFAPKQTNIQKTVYSVKAGFEVVFRYIGWGAEIKTATDLKNTAFYFVPKAGISYFGKINIYYHYGLPLTNNLFSSQFSSQVSVQYNFAKKMAASFKDGGDH